MFQKILFNSVCFALYSIILYGQIPTEFQRDSCYVLNKIQIEGDRRTKDEVIMREINLKSGDCIDLSRFSDYQKSNQERLMNLQLFNHVVVDFEIVSDKVLNLKIYLQERFPIMPQGDLEFADRNFNVWWNEKGAKLNRLNLGLGVKHQNLRGNREEIEVYAQIGYTPKIGFMYNNPYIDKAQKQGVGFSLFGLQNQEIAYKTNHNKLLFFQDLNRQPLLRRIEASAWYLYRADYATTHKTGWIMKYQQIGDTIAALNPDYLGNGNTKETILHFFYRIQYNGVDNWNYPLKGHRIVGSIQQNFALREQIAQTVFYLQADWYQRIVNRFYSSIVLRLRSSSKANQQPYILRQNLGYEYDYVRGYEYYVIDGAAFGLARASVKYEIVNFNLHLPVKYFSVIPIRMYAKFFADVGRAYNPLPINDHLYNNWMRSAGIGLDIITMYDVKLRVEYTVNHWGEKGLYLHRSGE